MILPQPGEDFHWTEVRARPALVCDALEPVACHAFSTRRWPLGVASPEDDTGWRAVAEAMDVDQDRLLRVRQVHEAGIVVHRAGRSIVQDVAADIVVTDDSSVALAVQTADCVPVLIADLRTGAVAAAHAGWRGLALRVPAAAVAALIDQLGSRPSRLVAAIGPSIGSCCYEVGDDVRGRFRAAGFSEAELHRWFLAEPLQSAANPSLPHLSKGARAGRWFLDLWAATRDGLMAAGVPGDQVFTARLCTASHVDAFCSYRRDGVAAGRMATAIRKLAGFDPSLRWRADRRANSDRVGRART